MLATYRDDIVSILLIFIPVAHCLFTFLRWLPWRPILISRSSINKKSDTFTESDDVDGCDGHKWGLKALMRRLAADGVDTDAVWRNICDIVVKVRLHFQIESKGREANTKKEAQIL